MVRWRAAWRAAAPYVVPAVVCLGFLLALFWRLWTPIDGARRAFAWDAQWEYWGDLQFIVDAVRAGELPLWNPYDRGGYPFHADPQVGLLYPPTWLLVAAGLLGGGTPWWLIAVKIVFHFWIAMLGVYAYLRSRNNPISACYVGSVVFVLSYPFARNLFSALNWNIAWAAWALWAVDRWAAAPSRGRAAVLAVVMALVALAGAPASAWYTLLIVGPYAGWAVVHHSRRVADRRSYARMLATTGALAAGLALAMVAAQLVSTAALLADSIRAARSLDFITTTTFGLDDVAGFIISRMPGGNTYLGFAAVLWAGILLCAFPSPRALVLLAVAVIGALSALGAEGDFLAVEASVLAPFGLFRRAHRYLYVLQLPVAILAAEGLTAVLRCQDEAVRRRLRGAVVAVGALGVLVFGIGFVVQAAPSQQPQPLRDAFALTCVSILAATWVTYLILRHTGSWQRAFAGIAVAVVVVDLWFCRGPDIDFMMHAVPRTQRDALVGQFAGVPLEARIFDRKILKFRPGIRLAIRDFGGYEGDPMALQRWALLKDRALRAPRLLAHANVRYLLEAGDRRTPKSPDDRKAMRELERGIFELDPVAPAVLWVGQWGAAVSAPAALEQLISTEPGTAAVVDGPALLPSPAVAAGPPTPGRLVELTRNHLVAHVDAPGPGLVVIHETHHPNWRAAVDGQPAAIVPTNVMFRGVHVGPGPHRIEMWYEPPWYRALAILNPLGLVVALILIALERRRR
jgi:hypothetical protein